MFNKELLKNKVYLLDHSVCMKVNIREFITTILKLQLMEHHECESQTIFITHRGVQDTLDNALKMYIRGKMVEYNYTKDSWVNMSRKELMDFFETCLNYHILNDDIDVWYSTPKLTYVGREDYSGRHRKYYQFKLCKTEGTRLLAEFHKTKDHYDTETTITCHSHNIVRLVKPYDGVDPDGVYRACCNIFRIAQIEYEEFCDEFPDLPRALKIIGKDIARYVWREYKINNNPECKLS